VEGNIMPDHQGKRLRGIAERLSSAGLSLQENMVRKAILIAFADAGQGPSVEALTHALGLPLAAVRAACRTLAGADLILGQDEKRAISSAYPFSGCQTAHEVLLGGHTTRYAMCAIDALGMPLMLGQEARIRSTCFFCQTPVTVDIAGGVLQLDPQVFSG
jgi:hypothetical protein